MNLNYCQKMRYLSLTICCLLTLSACNQKQNTQSGETLAEAIETKIPDEFDCFSGSRIFIKYKQPVNDYTVKVMCMPYKSGYDRDRANEIWGQALLYFEKEDSKFYVYNESFSDSTLYYINEQKPEDGLTLSLDYLPKKEDEYLSHNSPFFFSDVDFDGEEELIINNWRSGVRYCNTYDIYKIDGCQLQQMTIPPYYKISDYNAEFSPVNKSIILNSYGGWNNGISLIYKIERGKPTLIRGK